MQAGIALALALLAALPGCAAGPGRAAESLVRGQVLRGPVRPGPQRLGEPDEAPFAAAFAVRDEAGSVVATFRSDEDGRFELSLQPGRYTVVPDPSSGLMGAERQAREIVVSAGRPTEVVLHFDTGMR